MAVVHINIALFGSKMGIIRQSIVYGFLSLARFARGHRGSEGGDFLSHSVGAKKKVGNIRSHC